MNIEINPDFEKSTTLRALSAFLTLLADEADGSTKDSAILSAIVQKGLNHVDASLEEQVDAETHGASSKLTATPVVMVGGAEVDATVQENTVTLAEAPVVKRTRKQKVAEPDGSLAAAVAQGNVVAGAEKTREGSVPATTTPADTSTSATSASLSSPTIDDVRAALQRYTAVHGMPDGIALLKNYGAGRISELGIEQYPLFIAECDAVEAA